MIDRPPDRRFIPPPPLLDVAGACRNRTYRGPLGPQLVLKTSQTTRPNPPPQAFLVVTAPTVPKLCPGVMRFPCGASRSPRENLRVARHRLTGRVPIQCRSDQKCLGSCDRSTSSRYAQGLQPALSCEQRNGGNRAVHVYRRSGFPSLGLVGTALVETYATGVLCPQHLGTGGSQLPAMTGKGIGKSRVAQEQ